MSPRCSSSVPSPSFSDCCFSKECCCVLETVSIRSGHSASAGCSQSAKFHRRTPPTGKAYTLVIESDGQVSTVTLTVAAGPSRLLGRAVELFVSLVWRAVGLFVGFARPGDQEARLAFAVAVGTGMVYIQANIVHGVLPGSQYQPLQLIICGLVIPVSRANSVTGKPRDSGRSQWLL